MRRTAARSALRAGVVRSSRSRGGPCCPRAALFKSETSLGPPGPRLTSPISQAGRLKPAGLGQADHAKQCEAASSASSRRSFCTRSIHSTAVWEGGLPAPRLRTAAPPSRMTLTSPGNFVMLLQSDLHRRVPRRASPCCAVLRRRALRRARVVSVWSLRRGKGVIAGASTLDIVLASRGALPADTTLQ